LKTSPKPATYRVLLSLLRSLRLILLAAVLCAATGARAQLLPFGDAFLPTFTFTDTYQDIVVESEFGGYEQAADGKVSIRAKMSMKDVIVEDMILDGNMVTIVVGDLQHTLDLALAEISNPSSGPDKGFTVYTWILTGINPTTGEELEVGIAALKYNATELRFNFDAEGIPSAYTIRAMSEAGGDGPIEDTPLVLSAFSVGPYGLEDVLVYYNGTASLSDKTVRAGTDDEQQFFGLANVKLNGLLDASPPTITVDYPTHNLRLNDRPATFFGKCDDRFGIQGVEIQVDNAPWEAGSTEPSDDPWIPATIEGNIWTVENLDLTPGKLRIRARCTDANGLVRLVVRTAEFSNVSNLTVTAAGDAPGRVTALFFPALSYNPATPPAPSITTKHADNKALVVTAVPGAGAVFDGWTSNKTLTPQQLAAPRLSFKHQPNMVLTARFLINPFIPVKGRYNGLATGAAPENNGFLSINLVSNGTFTGSVKIGPLTLKLKGKFSNTGRFTRTVKVGTKTYTIDLTLNVTGTGTQQVTGTVVGDNINVAIDALRSSFDKITNPAPQAGTYNVILPPVPGQPDTYPTGIGFGRVTVSASGAARFTGRTGTTPVFNAAAQLSADGKWPFYGALYGKRGAIAGIVTFDSANAAHDLSSTLQWFKPAGVKEIPVYTAGFNGQSTLLGAKVAPLVAGQRLFLGPSGGAGKFTVNAPADVTPLPALQATLDGSLGTDHKLIVTALPTDPIQTVLVTINPLTGMFGGSFKEGATLTKFNGIIVGPKLNRAAGYFRRGAHTGALEITAPPPVP